MGEAQLKNGFHWSIVFFFF